MITDFYLAALSGRHITANYAKSDKLNIERLFYGQSDVTWFKEHLTTQTSPLIAIYCS